MNHYHYIFAMPLLATLASCSRGETNQAVEQDQPATNTGRHMDEVPAQRTLSNGNWEYSYVNGCVVVLEPKRAVVKSEGINCQSYHRDISLLYASGD